MLLAAAVAAGRACCAIVDLLCVLFANPRAQSEHLPGLAIPLCTLWLVLAGGLRLLLLLWFCSGLLMLCCWPLQSGLGVQHVSFLFSFLLSQPEGLFKHCQRPFFQSCSWLAAWQVPPAALHTYMLMCCALTTYSSPSQGCRRVRWFLSSLLDVGVGDSPLVVSAAPFCSCGPFAT
jgi:hypothetical protein